MSNARFELESFHKKAGMVTNEAYKWSLITSFPPKDHLKLHLSVLSNRMFLSVVFETACFFLLCWKIASFTYFKHEKLTNDWTLKPNQRSSGDDQSFNFETHRSLLKRIKPQGPILKKSFYCKQLYLLNWDHFAVGFEEYIKIQFVLTNKLETALVQLKAP